MRASTCQHGRPSHLLETKAVLGAARSAGEKTNKQCLKSQHWPEDVTFERVENPNFRHRQ